MEASAFSFPIHHRLPCSLAGRQTAWRSCSLRRIESVEREFRLIRTRVRSEWLTVLVWFDPLTLATERMTCALSPHGSVLFRLCLLALSQFERGSPQK